MNVRFLLASALGLLTLAACTTDAPTGNAWRASESAGIITASARQHCPGAKKEIAAAEAAGQAADAAGDALHASGKILDQKTSIYEGSKRQADYDTRKYKEKNAEVRAAKDTYEKADAAYLKAEEERESYNVQAALAGFDTSDANLNGALDRMKAGLEVPVALANAAQAKARRDALSKEHRENVRKYRDPIKQLEKEEKALLDKSVGSDQKRDADKAEMDKAKADYDAKREEAAKKTAESKAANARLLEVCPQARRGLETPEARSRGLDIFNTTKSQHQEPHH